MGIYIYETRFNIVLESKQNSSIIHMVLRQYPPGPGQYAPENIPPEIIPLKNTTCSKALTLTLNLTVTLSLTPNPTLTSTLNHAYPNPDANHNHDLNPNPVQVILFRDIVIGYFCGGLSVKIVQSGYFPDNNPYTEIQSYCCLVFDDINYVFTNYNNA